MGRGGVGRASDPATQATQARRNPTGGRAAGQRIAVGEMKPILGAMTPHPSMTRFVLIRHGSVAEPWPQTVYGCLDIPLSEEGMGEARATARRLAGIQWDAVVSSGLQRAEFTAQLLREPLGLQRRDERDLQEIDRGKWAGVPLADLARTHPGAWRDWHMSPWQERSPGGESLADVEARVLPCIGRLADEFSEGTVAVVTHLWVIRTVLCAVLQLPARSAEAMRIVPSAAVVIDWPADEDQGNAQGSRAVLAGLAVEGPPVAGGNWFRSPSTSPAQDNR